MTLKIPSSWQMRRGHLGNCCLTRERVASSVGKGRRLFSSRVNAQMLESCSGLSGMFIDGRRMVRKMNPCLSNRPALVAGCHRR